jgi:phage gpG-like protein
MPNLTFGFETALQKLAAAPARLGRAMEAGLADSALIVVKATKENIVKGRTEWPPIKFPGRRVSKVSRSQVTPLLDTGTMLRSIHHELEAKGGDSLAYIGWGVRYGAVHERGTTKAGRGRHTVIPARPHMRPAVKENIDQIRSAFFSRVRSALV